MRDSSTPVHLVYESLGTSFHGMCFGIQSANPCPFRKDFVPGTLTEHLKLFAGSAPELLLSLVLPFLWNNSGTQAEKSCLLVQAAKWQTGNQPVKNREPEDVLKFGFLFLNLKIYPPWKRGGLHFCSHWSSNNSSRKGTLISFLKKDTEKTEGFSGVGRREDTFPHEQCKCFIWVP